MTAHLRLVGGDATADLVREARRLRAAIDGASGLMAGSRKPSPEQVVAMLADCARFCDRVVERLDGSRKAGRK